MTCPATSMTGVNKSKEDFIWFIKKYRQDVVKLYHCLLKMFVELTPKETYGYAPIDTELYKTEQDKEQARQKMFNSMYLKGTVVITLDEWLKFCLEHIIAKTATMDPHPILDHGNMEHFSLELLELLSTPICSGSCSICSPTRTQTRTVS